VLRKRPLRHNTEPRANRDPRRVGRSTRSQSVYSQLVEQAALRIVKDLEEATASIQHCNDVIRPGGIPLPVRPAKCVREHSATTTKRNAKVLAFVFGDIRQVASIGRPVLCKILGELRFERSDLSLCRRPVGRGRKDAFGRSAPRECLCLFGAVDFSGDPNVIGSRPDRENRQNKSQTGKRGCSRSAITPRMADFARTKL